MAGSPRRFSGPVGLNTVSRAPWCTLDSGADDGMEAGQRAAAARWCTLACTLSAKTALPVRFNIAGQGCFSYGADDGDRKLDGKFADLQGYEYPQAVGEVQAGLRAIAPGCIPRRAPWWCTNFTDLVHPRGAPAAGLFSGPRRMSVG